MKIIRSYFVLLIIVIISCSENKIRKLPNVEVINIDIRKSQSCDGWNGLISDIDFICLETPDSGLIDRISNIQISDNEDFLIRSQNRKLILFGKNGKCKYVFSKYGKGINELPFVMDGCLMPEGDLYVFGSLQYLQIDSKKKVIRSKNLPVQKCFSISNTPVDWFIDSRKNFYMWFTSYSDIRDEEKYSLIITDSAGDILSKRLKYSHYAGGGQVFFQSNKDILLAPPLLNDTIYKVSNSDIFPAYKIDFGANSYIAGSYKPHISNDINNPYHIDAFFSENKICHSILRPVENNRFLVFRFSTSETYLTCIFDKLNKTVNLIRCFEQTSESVFTPGLIFASYNNKFFSFVDAWKIRQMLDENLTTAPFLQEQRRLDLLNKLKDVKETDNPVLMIITTKNQTNEER